MIPSIEELEGLSIEEACEKYATDATTVYGWRKMRGLGGSRGLPVPSKEELGNLSLESIAYKFNVCTATVRKWRKLRNLEPYKRGREKLESPGREILETMSRDRAAGSFGVSRCTVDRWWRECGLDFEERCKIDIPEGLSGRKVRDVMDEYNVSRWKATKWISHNEIEDFNRRMNDDEGTRDC